MARDVVLLANSSWAGLQNFNTRIKNVACTFAQRPDVSTVTVVDYPRFGPHLGGRSLIAERPSWDPRVRNVVVRVPTTAERKHPLLDSVAFAVASRALRQFLGQTSRERVVICATPAAARMLGRLGEDRWLFDAIDDMRNSESAKHVLRRMVDGYATVAKLECPVTTVSQSLALRLGGEWVPNGVDAQRFAAAPPASWGGKAIAPSPVAMYVGTVEGRIDHELVQATAKALPDVRFVFVGPITDDRMQSRLNAPNVVLAGPMAHDLVPSLLKGADVCILPHRRSGFSNSMNPLKLYEYLASGQPIVATPVAGTEMFADVVSLASDARQFARAIESALRNPGDRLSRQVRVAEMSWSTVAESLLTMARAPGDQ